MSEDAHWSILHLIVAGLSLLGTQQCNSRKQKTIKNLEIIEQKPEFSVNEFVSHILTKYNSQISQRIQNSQIDRFIFIDDVFVKGQCYGDTNILSKDKQQRLIVSVTKYFHEKLCMNEKKDVTQTSVFIKEKKKVVDNFNLCDNEIEKSSPVSISVQDFFDANYSNVLNQIGSKIEKIIKYAASSLVAGACIKIGTTKQQLGIKIGDRFAVYGKAVFDLQNMTVKFNLPTAFIKSKQDYLNMINTNANILKFFTYSFGLIAVIEIYNAIRSLTKTQWKKTLS